MKLRIKNLGWNKEAYNRAVQLIRIAIKDYVKSDSKKPKEIEINFCPKVRNPDNPCYAEILVSNGVLYFYEDVIRRDIEKLQDKKKLPKKMLFDWFILSTITHELVHLSQIQECLPCEEEIAKETEILLTPELMNKLEEYNEELLIDFFRVLHTRVETSPKSYRSYVG